MPLQIAPEQYRVVVGDAAPEECPALFGSGVPAAITIFVVPSISPRHSTRPVTGSARLVQVRSGEVHGNLVPDAYLAALAIERGLELNFTDGDFARFAGLKWRNPLAPGQEIR
jgi:hypothetical protein